MDIFAEIKELNFPPNEYIVVGSAIMVAMGIRKTNDLDIVVTPKLFEKCKKEGWEIRSWTKHGIPGKEWLKKGDIELYVQLSRKTGGISAKELLKNAVIVENIPFITLESLMDFKQEYGRPKDFDDIRMIREFLGKTSNTSTR